MRGMSGSAVKDGVSALISHIPSLPTADYYDTHAHVRKANTKNSKKAQNSTQLLSTMYLEQITHKNTEHSDNNLMWSSHTM